MKQILIYPLTLFSFFCISKGWAQEQRISLQQALSFAQSNNLLMQINELKLNYQKEIIKTSKTIPNTDITFQGGQYNSTFFDTQIGVSQSLNFPTVYKRQKEVYEKEWDKLASIGRLKEYELKKLLSKTYYTYLYLIKKRKLLVTSDSIYGQFLEKADLRLRKGETNNLEKSTAEVQKNAIENQLTQIDAEINYTAHQFQTLLGIKTEKYLPDTSTDLKAKVTTLYSGNLQEHPTLQIAKEEISLSKAVTRYEKAKLLPDLNLGIYNTSIQGNGANEVYYSASKRFTYFQVGIGLPIFTSAQKNKIKAAKIQEELSEKNYQMTQILLNQKIQELTNTLSATEKNINNYEKNTNKSVTTIRSTATIQLNEGEIHFLEWVYLINQSIASESIYLDDIQKYNNQVIDFNYLILE